MRVLGEFYRENALWKSPEALAERIVKPAIQSA
jgi:hypothetical protein